MTKLPHGMILRSIFLTPEMDALLRQKAFEINVSKSELIRTYIENGLNGEFHPQKTGDSSKTFEDAIAGYISVHSRDVRASTVANWTRYKRLHLDKIGDTPITDLSRAKVIEFLEPYWIANTTPLGSMLRSLGERSWDYARASDWCSGENPWNWTLLSKVLSRRPMEVSHPAVPYTRLPMIYHKLANRVIHPPGKRGPSGFGERALRLCILTASRPMEVAGMRWSEIDLGEAVWTLPAECDKEGHERRIPLSNEALDCLGEPRSPYVAVFSDKLSRDTLVGALRRHVGLQDMDKTVHGTARSSFRDWAGDETDFATEVIQLCLGHRIGETDRAYYRSDALRKRRAVFDAWAEYLTGYIPDDYEDVQPMVAES